MHTYNTSVLFGPDLRDRGRLSQDPPFSTSTSPEAVRCRESESRPAGRPPRPVVAETPLGRLGLSICYDLRFGNLYRRLAGEGSEILCVPAAFTMTTGRDHQELLLRARAVECQAYVLAPAQYGRPRRPGPAARASATP